MKKILYSLTSMNENLTIFKTVLIGDMTTGKTSIRKMYCGEGFRNEYLMTLGSEFSIKKIDDDKILQVWDLAGQGTFNKIRKNYYRGMQGGIIVFDLTNRESFENLDYWLTEMKEFGGKDVPTIILGNKVDLVRDSIGYIKKHEIDQYISDLSVKHGKNINYVQTSAKTGLNINNTFKYLFDEIKSRVFHC